MKNVLNLILTALLLAPCTLKADEGQLDWLHTGGPGNQHVDNIHGESEKGFGMLTLGLETAWERDSTSGVINSGVDNVDLGAHQDKNWGIDTSLVFEY